MWSKTSNSFYKWENRCTIHLNVYYQIDFIFIPNSMLHTAMCGNQEDLATDSRTLYGGVDFSPLKIKARKKGYLDVRQVSTLHSWHESSQKLNQLNWKLVTSTKQMSYYRAGDGAGVVTGLTWDTAAFVVN